MWGQVVWPSPFHVAPSVFRRDVCVCMRLSDQLYMNNNLTDI